MHHHRLNQSIWCSGICTSSRSWPRTGHVSSGWKSTATMRRCGQSGCPRHSWPTKHADFATQQEPPSGGAHRAGRAALPRHGGTRKDGAPWSVQQAEDAVRTAVTASCSERRIEEIRRRPRTYTRRAPRARTAGPLEKATEVLAVRKAKQALTAAGASNWPACCLDVVPSHNKLWRLLPWDVTKPLSTPFGHPSNATDAALGAIRQGREREEVGGVGEEWKGKAGTFRSLRPQSGTRPLTD